MKKKRCIPICSSGWQKFYFATGFTTFLLLATLLQVSAGDTPKIKNHVIVKMTEQNQNSVQQPQKKKVSGKILDSQGIPLPGAMVLIKNTQLGTSTDSDGNFTLNNVPENAELEFSFVGYVKVTKIVKGKAVFNVILMEDMQSIEEVAVVAFGTQKKESVIGSISTIASKELKTPSSNFTNTLAGRIAGIVSYQRSGEPGADNASFFIRGVTSFGYKKDPLILIDNIELSTDDLARMQPDDIESFSIMKDATATALYGARGANGVILVKTKQGVKGKAKLNFRVENSLSMPTRMIELADPVTYMKLHNEAISTRDPLSPLMYSDDKIDNTRFGSGSYIYPSTNWQEEMLKDFTMNQRVNMNVSGGGDVARYYVAGSFSQDNGILKKPDLSSFNNNINVKSYTLRSNVNVDITKTTELVIRLSGSFEDFSGPIGGGSSLYNKIMKSNPVLFPAFYPKDDQHQFENHILFGNAQNGEFLNPYAEMVKGYSESSNSNLGAQFELNQELDMVVKGLKARILFNTNRVSYYITSRSFSPYFYRLDNYDYLQNKYEIVNINPDGGTEYLNYNPGEKTISANLYSEAALTYTQQFKKHGISGLLVYQMRNNYQPNAATLQQSLPYRNIGLSGRFTYSYDSRYFLETNFGYNGSERFHSTNRYGFFPSGGLAYMVSNEKYFESIKPVISSLKLRASAGFVGNDAIGSGRFLYLSEINMNDGGRGSTFGYDNGYSKNGISVTRYSDPGISWETSFKTNYAVEFTIKKSLNIIAEYYRDTRTNILLQRVATPASMGLWVQPYANVGEAKGSGIDISMDMNKHFGNNYWLQLRGNFTYGTGEFTKYEEYDYTNEPWKSRVGYSPSQMWGYIAEGLFVDEKEVANSPQQFGEYGAGDIKYRDVNRDGYISSLDQVPIGHPTEPEIVYGFGASGGSKRIDISLFFQGLARESFWMDYNQMSPFFNTNSGSTGSNALTQFVADNHWSENNRDIYAAWPRLSPYSISNNAQRSTWFMRNGSFLRLKQVELGYTLSANTSKKFGVKNLRVYFTGNNLLSFSSFKLWDVEMAGNGLAYPIQRVFNLGLNVTF